MAWGEIFRQQWQPNCRGVPYTRRPIAIKKTPLSQQDDIWMQCQCLCQCFCFDQASSWLFSRPRIWLFLFLLGFVAFIRFHDCFFFPRMCKLLTKSFTGTLALPQTRLFDTFHHHFFIKTLVNRRVEENLSLGSSFNEITFTDWVLKKSISLLFIKHARNLATWRFDITTMFSDMSHLASFPLW